MATPNNTMTKLASLERGSSNINRLIVANLRNYSDLEEAVQAFLVHPSDEAAQELDARFAACDEGANAIRQAVAQVAMTAFDSIQTEEDGTLPVSGVDEEDGVRLM